MTAAHERTLVVKTAWSTVANACTALGNVLATVIVARALGPEGAGRTAYLLWAATTGALVVSFGLPACLQRYVAEFHGRGDDARAQRLARDLVRRIVAIAAAVVVAAVIALHAFERADALSLALLVLFASHAAAEAYRSWLLGAQRFHVAARVAAATVIVQVAGVAAGSALWGVPGAIGGYAAGLLVPAVGAARIALLPAHAAAPARELRARLRKYSGETYVALVVALAAWSQLEVVFLRPSWGDHGVAMFTTALVIARLAAHGPTLLAGGLLPHLTERAAAADAEAVRRTFAAATRILGALALPLCFGAAAVSPQLVPALYGDAFRDAVPVAIVLSVGAAVGAIASAGSALLYAMERSRYMLLSGVLGAALAATGFALVIPTGGALGAAITRSIVQAAMFALGAWYITQRLRVPLPFASLARSALAATACAAVAAIVVVAVPSAPALAAAVPAGALTYALAARALRTLHEDDARALHDATLLLPAVARPAMRAIVHFVAGNPR